MVSTESGTQSVGRPGTTSPPQGTSTIVGWSERDGWRFREEWWKATFGRRLRAARKAMHWSQERLAQQMCLVAKQYDDESANVNSLRFTISNYERNVQAPNPRSLHYVADALNIDVKALGLPLDPDFPWPPPRAKRSRNLPERAAGRPGNSANTD